MPRGTYPTDTNNFAPRLGVVWDPNGDGRTTVRGAWGIFYDALAGQGDFFQNGVLAPPFTPLVEVNAPPASITLANPLDAITGGATLFPPGLTIIGWGEDFQTPYAHHFNATVQRQVGRTLGVEAGYVGSRGRHLPIFIEVNPGLFTPGQTAPGARLFPAFALVRPTFSAAESSYDSFQASARMRQSHGVNFLASYTYGHARDHVSGLNIGGEPRPVLPVTIGDQASFDQALALEWGDALFDVRHRFVVSFGARAADAARHGRGHGACRRRLAAERHRPDADGLPAGGDRRRDRHPLPDQPAGRDVRPERERAAHGRTVVQHGLLRSAAQWR